MSIRRKAIFVFLFISLSTSLGSGIIYYFFSRNTIIENIKNNLDTIISFKSREISDYLIDQREDFIFWTDNVLLDELSDKEIDLKLKGKVVARNNLYYDISIYDQDGKIAYSSSDEEIGKYRKIISEDIFREEIYFKEFYYDASLEESISLLSYPILISQERHWVVARISLKDIQSFVSQKLTKYNSIQTYLISDTKYLITQVDPNDKTRVVSSMAIDKCIETKGQDTLEYFGFDKKQVIGSYKWLNEEGVCIVSRVEIEEAYKPIKELNSNIAIASVFLVFFATVWGYFTARYFTRPINYLIEGVNEYVKGNFIHNISVNSNDEFGKMAKAFNEMSNSIKEYRENMQGMVDKKTIEISENKKQLESLNELMIGREVKMSELKLKIKELEGFLQSKKHNYKRKKTK